MQSVRMGDIHADVITKKQALDIVFKMATYNCSGYIVTPNVDHIVQAKKNTNLKNAYAKATLSLADGQPLLWMSRLLGMPLPEKISGSDFIRPVMSSAAKNGFSVFFCGAAPGVAETAADVLRSEFPELKIAGFESPPLGFEKDAVYEKSLLKRIQSKNPDIVLIALGAPKQEILMERWNDQGARFLMIGIGAGLDFIAGKVKRAPAWLSRCGFEWLYRMMQEPKRLVKRYLVDDISIIPVFLKTLRLSKESRMFTRTIDIIKPDLNVEKMVE